VACGHPGPRCHTAGHWEGAGRGAARLRGPPSGPAPAASKGPSDGPAGRRGGRDGGGAGGGDRFPGPVGAPSAARSARCPIIRAASAAPASAPPPTTPPGATLFSVDRRRCAAWGIMPASGRGKEEGSMRQCSTKSPGRGTRRLQTPHSLREAPHELSPQRPAPVRLTVRASRKRHASGPPHHQPESRHRPTCLRCSWRAPERPADTVCMPCLHARQSTSRQSKPGRRPMVDDVPYALGLAHQTTTHRHLESTHVPRRGRARACRPRRPRPCCATDALGAPPCVAGGGQRQRPTYGLRGWRGPGAGPRPTPRPPAGRYKAGRALCPPPQRHAAAGTARHRSPLEATNATSGREVARTSQPDAPLVVPRRVRLHARAGRFAAPASEG